MVYLIFLLFILVLNDRFFYNIINILYIAWDFINILFRKYRSIRNRIKIKVYPRVNNKVKFS